MTLQCLIKAYNYTIMKWLHSFYMVSFHPVLIYEWWCPIFLISARFHPFQAIFGSFLKSLAPVGTVYDLTMSNAYNYTINKWLHSFNVVLFDPVLIYEWLWLILLILACFHPLSGHFWQFFWKIWPLLGQFMTLQCLMHIITPVMSDYIHSMWSYSIPC